MALEKLIVAKHPYDTPEFVVPDSGRRREEVSGVVGRVAREVASVLNLNPT